MHFGNHANLVLSFGITSSGLCTGMNIVVVMQLVVVQLERLRRKNSVSSSSASVLVNSIAISPLSCCRIAFVRGRKIPEEEEKRVLKSLVKDYSLVSPTLVKYVVYQNFSLM